MVADRFKRIVSFYRPIDELIEKKFEHSYS